MSLGRYLKDARERTSLTPEDIVTETRIPRDYLRMLESDDYSRISDQLYLLPFLRRYATFLGLDPEEVAMMFVREVQRADNSPSGARLDAPLENSRRRRNPNRTRLVVIGVLIVLAAVAYALQMRHHDSAETAASATQETPDTTESPSTMESPATDATAQTPPASAPPAAAAPAAAQPPPSSPPGAPAQGAE